MKNLLTALVLLLALFSCSQKEKPAPKLEKGFELSNAMLKSTTFAKATLSSIEDDYQYAGILDKSRLHVTLRISPNDPGKIKVGDTVQVISPNYLQQKVNAVIEKTDASAGRPMSLAMARCINPVKVSEPSEALEVRLSRKEETLALALPAKAVIRDKNRYFVVVYKSQTDIRIREIKLLNHNLSTIYIASGLEKGEMVITNHQLSIYRSLAN